MVAWSAQVTNDPGSIHAREDWMIALRLAMVGCLFFGLTALAQAEAKKADKDASNKEKLVGTWEAVKGDLPEGSTVDFTKDGKLKLTAKVQDKTITMEGKYELDGNKLKVTLKQGDKEMKQTLTIKTLTDKILVTLDEEGKTDEFKKKK
jgi:uncharacterized protein (TIGR03066 family)